MRPRWLTLALAAVAIVASLPTTVTAISCHQCDSNSQLHCSEQWDYALAPGPGSCDHLHEAKYCVKATGMYGGRIGTFRFCASKDRGNYCDYVQRPGDDREYRACIHTCRHDGCNSASAPHGWTFSRLLPVLVAALLAWRSKVA